MTPYFSTPERKEILLTVAESWLGTPFMPNACLKGLGVSCQKLAGAIFRESGFSPAGLDIPDGPMDWSNAQKESLIVNFMNQRPEFVAMDYSPDTIPGDMLGFNLGGCIHHCGVVIMDCGKFIHCLRGIGTAYGNVRDATYMKRIKKIWRPIV